MTAKIILACIACIICAACGTPATPLPTATVRPRATASPTLALPTATARPRATASPTLALPTATPLPTATVRPRATASAARGLPSAAGSNCPCDRNTLNCDDFPDSWSAQSCYLRCLEQTGRDIHQLDRDKDGDACEWKSR